VEVADAIVICAELGETVKPAGAHNQPGLDCVSLPCGFDYLAAPLHCLRVIAHCEGDDLRNSQNGIVKTAYARSWAMQGDPFQKCPHDEHSTNTC